MKCTKAVSCCWNKSDLDIESCNPIKGIYRQGPHKLYIQEEVFGAHFGELCLCFQLGCVNCVS